MEEKKITISELIRLQRTALPREFALSEFYPLTHSGVSAHHSGASARPRRESLAKPYVEAVARAAVTPQVEPKPWKKPWDK